MYAAEQDPYCYSGTDVLTNKAGLQDVGDLEEFEVAMTMTRAEEPLSGGSLDYAHYKAIHHHLPLMRPMASTGRPMGCGSAESTGGDPPSQPQAA